MIFVFFGVFLDLMVEWKYIIYEKVVIFYLNLDFFLKDILMKKKKFMSKINDIIFFLIVVSGMK